MVDVKDTVVTSSPEETMNLGRRIARDLRGGEVLALSGPLGAGKTTLIKGIAGGLGVEDTSEVRSPTFVLLRVYEGITSGGKPVSVNHVDGYRLDGGADFDDIGGRDLFEESSICLIEWADRIADGLPARRVNISLEHVDENTRRITISGSSS
jgi:tRNA threonylcarbamoyladenosine biosynthesis protein TsaE